MPGTNSRKPEQRRPLRKGWTTGACATAATRAAYGALLTGRFEDPVTITLPRGQTPSFALSEADIRDGTATAAIVKDAGDDPDVTHRALIRASVRAGETGAGVIGGMEGLCRAAQLLTLQFTPRLLEELLVVRAQNSTPAAAERGVLRVAIILNPGFIDENEKRLGAQRECVVVHVPFTSNPR